MMQEKYGANSYKLLHWGLHLLSRNDAVYVFFIAGGAVFFQQLFVAEPHPRYHR